MLAALGAVLFLATQLIRTSSEESSDRGGFPLADAVLVLSLVLFPPLMFAFARIFTHTFHVRYTVPAIFGYAAIGGLLASRLPRRIIVARGLSALLLLVMAVASIREIGHNWATPDIDMLQSVRNDLPIVVGEGGQFIELRENAPPRLRDRLVYLTTPPEVLNRDPTNENIVKNWTGIYPMPVYPAQEFLAGHRGFLLYHAGKGAQPMTDWLAKRVGSFGVIGRQGDRWVFLVSP